MSPFYYQYTLVLVVITLIPFLSILWNPYRDPCLGNCIFSVLNYDDPNYLWKEDRPVVYSEVKRWLQPNYQSDQSYKDYLSRLQSLLYQYATLVTSCYKKGFSSCLSYNSSEVYYASKPYNESDLVLRIPSSVPILLNSGACNSADVEVVIGMVTAPSQFIERSTIRDTWCNRTAMNLPNIRCIFFVGYQLTANSSFLKEEAELFDDIIQFDLVDTYLNLTLLQLQGYNWTLHHCSRMKYYIRVDTDMYVNIPLILNQIIPANQSRFVYGYPFINAEPVRDPLHKNYLPTWLYPKKRFPPYLSGCLCIWSRDIVELIVSGSSIVRPIHYVDDVYYGQIFEYYHIPLTRDLKRLKVVQIPISSYLGYRVVAAHRYSPIDIVAIFTLFPHCLCLIENNKKDNYIPNRFFMSFRTESGIAFPSTR